MKTETLAQVQKTLRAYDSGELGAKETFIKLLLPVMVEVMEEGGPVEQKPLEISEAAMEDIFRRKEEGTVTDIQVLALILLDVIQAEQNNEKFAS